jgi:heme exporter protein D
VDHLSTLVPIAVLGFHALARERIALGDVMRRSAHEDRALHEGRGAPRARGTGDAAR